MLIIKSIKPKYHDLTNIFFHKTALGMSFLTRIIESVRIVFLPTVYRKKVEEDCFSDCKLKSLSPRFHDLTSYI